MIGLFVRAAPPDYKRFAKTLLTTARKAINYVQHDRCSELANLLANGELKPKTSVFYCVLGATGYPSIIATIGLMRRDFGAGSIGFAWEDLDEVL